ncbi:sds23p [Saccharomyces arboricola H-6]|uniref:Sds23p n=1 Tax=Saccharomyces arboricola (strain H-6 / AS 2.3317 / CBS 10644) TaxID=1160507 RepID=J8Q277_SACAR|nr:sds23p [Saccharomyces arboricola H-6]
MPQNTRHTSIVEMLSTPPQLPNSTDSHGLGLGDQTDRSSGGNRSDTESLHKSISNSSSSSSISTLDNTEYSNNSGYSLSTLNSQNLLFVHKQEWQHTPLSNLVEQNKLIFIKGSISVEEAFNTLVKHQLTSLPVENFPGDMNCLTFDYNDLNAYLLLVLNKIKVSNDKITSDCQSGKSVPVGEIVKLTPKNPFYKLPETENISTVIGILGAGVHRVAITNVGMTQIKGILSQRRLIKYLWDNARSFPNLKPLLDSSLEELKIGVLNADRDKPTFKQSRVISIQGDEHLIMALHKMYVERISSIAVVDHQGNLIGNISVTDVKHVTRTSQYPLLHNTCRHFVSVILNLRGLETGKDSFPIFHVYPTSSLARTFAKLVATKSHRLWIVQPNDNQSSASSEKSASPLPNTPVTTLPSLSSSYHSNTHSSRMANSPVLKSSDVTNNKINVNINLSGSPPFQPQSSPTSMPPPQSSNNSSASPAPAHFEKEYRTGKLIGVVSLTDILSVLARKQTHHKEIDPQMARKQRGHVG